MFDERARILRQGKGAATGHALSSQLVTPASGSAERFPAGQSVNATMTLCFIGQLCASGSKIEQAAGQRTPRSIAVAGAILPKEEGELR